MKKIIVLIIILIALLAIGLNFFYINKNTEKIFLETPNIVANEYDNFDIEFSRQNPDNKTEIQVLTLPTEITYDLATKTYKGTKGGTYSVVFSTNNSKYPTFTCSVKIADGSQSNPFVIKNVSEFMEIGNRYLSSELIRPLDAYYKLIADLDLSEEVFYPIGYIPLSDGGPTITEFTGQLDGNGFNINGLTFNDDDSGNMQNAGLFYTVGTYGKIKNLHLLNVDINGSFKYAGAFTGINHGTIERSSAEGDISSSFSGSILGGIAGENSTSYSGASYNKIARIDRIYSAINVSGSTNDAALFVGGISGKNLGAIIINSYVSSSSILSTNALASTGGIAGNNKYIESGELFLDSVVKNTYCNSLVTSSNAPKTGAIIGSNEDYPNIVEGSTEVYINRISGNYYVTEINVGMTGIGSCADYIDSDTESNRYSYFTVIGMTANEFKTKSNYISFRNNLEQLVSWDFSNVWNFNTLLNNGFPTLNYSGRTVSDEIHTLKALNTIVEIAGFDAIRNDLSGTYIINVPFDLGSIEWVPIGTKDKPFTGSFIVEGEGKILNLNITNYYKYAGFFGYLGEGAYIEGLTIDGIKIESGEYAGAIAGAAEGAVILNCSSIDSLDSSESESTIKTIYTATPANYYYIGGLIGYAENCTIGNAEQYNGCFVKDVKIFTPMINNKPVSVGGLIGCVAENTTASYSYSLTQITFDSSKSTLKAIQYLGALVGQNLGRIENCYTLAGYLISNYNIPASYAGGIVGYQNGGITLNSFAEASVTGHYAGGLVGKLKGTVENSYANNEVSAYLGGGLVGFMSSVDALIQNCYTTASLYTLDGASSISGLYAGTDSENYVKGTYVMVTMNTNMGGSAYVYTKKSVYVNVSTTDWTKNSRFISVLYNKDVTDGETIPNSDFLSTYDATTGKDDSDFKKWSTFDQAGFSEEAWWGLDGEYPKLKYVISKDGQLIDGAFTNTDYLSAKEKITDSGIDVFNDLTGNIDISKIKGSLHNFDDTIEFSKAEIGALFGNAVAILDNNVINGVQTVSILSLKIEYVSSTTVNCEFIIKGYTVEMKKELSGLYSWIIPKYIYIKLKTEAEITDVGLDILSSSIVINEVDGFSSDVMLEVICYFAQFFIGDKADVHNLADLNLFMQDYIPIFLNPWLAHINGQISFTENGMILVPDPI